MNWQRFVSRLSLTRPCHSKRPHHADADGRRHGINLDTSHSMADIEQGDTAIFSITITNTGNVHDAFVFWDPNSLEGQQEWLLPFGWQVNFPIRVELDRVNRSPRTSKCSFQPSEDPGAFVIYVKGWSEGEAHQIGGERHLRYS